MSPYTPKEVQAALPLYANLVELLIEESSRSQRIDIQRLIAEDNTSADAPADLTHLFDLMETRPVLAVKVKKVFDFSRVQAVQLAGATYYLFLNA